MNLAREQIEEALRAQDVEGLLELGAPRDEYAHEAARIAESVGEPGSEPTEDQLAATIQDVCVASFGPFSADQLAKRLPVYRHIARELSHPDPAS